MPSQCLLHRNLPIIEVADPVLLEELMLDRQLSALILMRLSDRTALVDPGRFDAFVARLRKIGHLPKVEG